MNEQEIRRATRDGINDAFIGFCKTATIVVGVIASLCMYPLIAIPAGAFWGVCMMALSENKIAHWIGFNILRAAFYGALVAGFVWLVPLIVK